MSKDIFEIIFLPLLLVAFLMLPFSNVLRKKKGASSAKRAFITNLCTFFAVMICAVIFPVGDYLFAEEVATEAVANSSAGLGYLGTALAVGLGSIGAGIAVGQGASAAIGAVSENDKTFGKAIIFVALGEGVALYGFLISFMILNKL